jgi:hypothetical protein
MARKKSKASYNNVPNYLDYLTALRKFFTNDVDIIPILEGFNFYVNGVYGTPYVDLFRMYDENAEDIHGAERTKSFIDDGTIGIINAQIYAKGGSLIQSLEDLRMYLNDRAKKYTIAYNPFINAYAEYEIPKINDLGTANPVVSTNGIEADAEDLQRNLALPLEDKKIIGGTEVSLRPKNKPKKSIWKFLGFLSYKNSKRYQQQQVTKYENTGIGGGILNKNNG